MNFGCEASSTISASKEWLKTFQVTPILLLHFTVGGGIYYVEVGLERLRIPARPRETVDGFVEQYNPHLGAKLVAAGENVRG